MFLDVSVVMPFYKRLDAFIKIFPRHNEYFINEGLEIVIVLDCLEEKNELLDFIKKYNRVKWRIVWNDKEHEWRNPAKPINVGIKNCKFNYILICSPESQFCSNVIHDFRVILEAYPNHYCIGQVAFAEGEEIYNIDQSSLTFYPYGSIMTKKDFFFSINGYNENLDRWGGDDDNIRSRLDLNGVKKLFIPEAKLIHHDFNNKSGRDRRKTNIPLDVLREFHYPNSILENKTWGQDFDKVIFDWEQI